MGPGVCADFPLGRQRVRFNCAIQPDQLSPEPRQSRTVAVDSTRSGFDHWKTKELFRSLISSQARCRKREVSAWMTDLASRFAAAALSEWAVPTESAPSTANFFIARTAIATLGNPRFLPVLKNVVSNARDSDEFAQADEFCPAQSRARRLNRPSTPAPPFPRSLTLASLSPRHDPRQWRYVYQRAVRR